MHEIYETPSNLAIPILSLVLLIYVILRKSRGAFAIFAVVNLFSRWQSVSQDESTSPIVAASCSEFIPTSNPYNWFSSLNAIRNKNFKQAEKWIEVSDKTYEKNYEKLNLEQREKFTETLEQIKSLKVRQLTFQSFDPEIGGRCGEHTSLILIRTLKDFIENNWISTYPIQIVEVVLRAEGKRGHEFIITHGLKENRELRSLEEMESYLKNLSQKPDAMLQDTWIKPGGICEKFSKLYSQRDTEKSLNFWQNNPLFWYFSTHLFRHIKVSMDYGERIQIPNDLPHESQKILLDKRQEVEDAIVISVREKNQNQSKHNSLAPG